MARDKLSDLKNRHKLKDSVSMDNTPSTRNTLYQTLKGKFRIWKNKTSGRVSHLTTLTILVAFVFFVMNISLNTANSINDISSSYSSLFQKLTRVLGTIRSQENLENALQDITTELEKLDKSLMPIDNRIWPFFSTSKLTQEAVELSKDWVLALRDLAQFKFGADGFTSQLPRNFTDYLSDFFETLPRLINKTNDFIFKIRLITSWAIWFPASAVEKIRNYIDLSQDIVDIVEDLHSNRIGILEFLGYKDLHKILIFNQNTGESRPTGGFIGSYLSVNISHGRFDIGKSQSIYSLDDYQDRAFVSFPVSWNYDLQYGRYDIHGIRNLNYFSCFPDTAKLIESEFSRVPRGQSADTILFLTPNLIQNLFDDTTELKVRLDESYTSDPDNQFVTITKDNFYNQIEKLTALDFKDINNPKSAITPILIAIVSDLDNIIANQDPIKLGFEFLNSGFSRDIQIWSKSQTLQNLWLNFHMAGIQTCQQARANCDQWWFKLNDSNCLLSNQDQTLSFVQANLSSDKRDIFANHDFNFIISKNNDSSYRKELTYNRSYKNLEQLQQKFNSRNGVTFIGFVLPPDAKNFKIESDSSLNTPFLRPFYLLKIKDQSNQELYTPPAIQAVIDSSVDINDTSFSYRQPDQSLVLGTYINEGQESTVRLTYSTKSTYTIFNPVPASNSNTISTNNMSNLLVLGRQNLENQVMVNSRGEGVLIISKN